MARRGWRSALVVTTYYHVTRARLALRRAGVPVVHTASARFDPGLREPWALLREVPGYYVYRWRGCPGG